MEEEFKTIDVNSIISAEISSLNSADVSVGDYTISSDLSSTAINTISKDVIGYSGSTPMYGYSSSKNPFSSSITSTSSSFSKTPIWSDEDDLQSRIELSDDFKKDILTKLLELDKDTLDIILNLLRGHLENIIDDPELLIKIDERDKEILDLKKEVSDLKKEINEIRKELIRKVPGNYGNNGISIDPRTGGRIMYDGPLYNYTGENIHEDIYTYLESKLKESILNCDNKNSISNNIDNADKNAF